MLDELAFLPEHLNLGKQTGDADAVVRRQGSRFSALSGKPLQNTSALLLLVLHGRSFFQSKRRRLEEQKCAAKGPGSGRLSVTWPIWSLCGRERVQGECIRRGIYHKTIWQRPEEERKQYLSEVSFDIEPCCGLAPHNDLKLLLN